MAVFAHIFFDVCNFFAFLMKTLCSLSENYYLCTRIASGRIKMFHKGNGKKQDSHVPLIRKLVIEKYNY